ncbi:MAG: AI-2E family transporter [Clostridia bacterium]|nr:AI-2E family transporter [Clostridia bacterium]
MELDSKNMKKIMLIVAFGIVLYIALQNFSVVSESIKNFMGILTPFILGACIAFVVNIPMKFIEKIFLNKSKNKVTLHRKIGKDNEKKSLESNATIIDKKQFNKGKRFISIFLSLFIVIFVLVLLLSLLIPELANVIKNCIQYLSGLPAELKPYIDEMSGNYPEFGEELSKLQIDFSNILNTTVEFLKNAGTGLVDLIGRAISSTVSSIANFVVGIIFTFYLLMSKEKIGRNFKRIVLAFLSEKHARKVLEITDMSKDAFTKFITGQLKEAVILGILCYIGMLILQLPYSLTISLLTTVTALIPIFGAFIGAAVGVILLLAVSPIKAIIFLIFIIVLQQIETNLIYPKVVGESVGLPGVIVIVAITVGGSIGGVIGMLVALPLASIIYTLIRASVAKRLKEKNINNV